MEVSDWVHALDTLPLWEKRLVPTGYEALWGGGPEPVWTWWWREKFPRL